MALTTALTTAVSVATAIVGGIASYQSNRAQENNAKALAEVERLNAKHAQQAANQKAIAIEQEATAKEQIQRQQNKAMLARNRARIGAGGLDYSGTPLLVEIDNATNMEMDIQNNRVNTQNQMQDARYQGHLLSISHENNARGYDFQKRQYNRGATNAVWGAVLEGFGGAAKGLASGYEKSASTPSAATGTGSSSNYFQKGNSYSYGMNISNSWNL